MDIIKKIAEKLRQCIRFNDYIGRTSSCCLGVILQDCDKWGIVRAADRLIKTTESTPIETSVGSLYINISVGGDVFSEDALTPAHLILHAEQYLFEMQALKGPGVAATPYGTGTSTKDLSSPEENNKSTKGRRATDHLPPAADIVL